MSRAKSAFKGGDSGPAIEPGNPEESFLWERISGDEMPPDKPLPAEEKQRLKAWIAAGAKWGTSPINVFATTSDSRAGYDWWSLQPVKQPALPAVHDPTWPINEIDHFVLSRLEAAGLKPAPQADARTLVLRLYCDLVGLPPTPEELDHWRQRLTAHGHVAPTASTDSSAIDETGYRELVEYLLASPHYGERWARHWLDVVRFGETQGFERNRIRENAWRYRDWVIGALNRDLPYDEFVRQQIAGDVLYPGDWDAMMATGYHVCGTWDQVAHVEGSAMMRVAARQDAIEDLVATLGQAFLGLSINCARCHDHKFDPISQKEYYQIAALIGGVTQQVDERKDLHLTRDAEREAKLRSELGGVRDQLAEFEKQLRDKYAADSANLPVQGLELLYRFESAENAKSVKDQSQHEPAIELSTDKKARYATAEPPKRVVKAIKKSGELTVEAWITPAKVKQSGPARIVTLSADSGQRNFTLGQDGDKFDFRLRTTKTNSNGIPSLSTPAGVVQTQQTHVVYTFRKGEARLFVNGKQVAQQKIGGDLSNWDEGFRLGLGDELSGGRRWEGDFHFVALYSHALSDEQARHHYDTQSKNVRAVESLEELLAWATDKEQAKFRQLNERSKSLEAELAEVSFTGSAHVIVPVQPPVFHVLARGDFRKPLEEVAPAGLAALTNAVLEAEFGLKPDAPEAERRVQLAAWLTDRRNPLTPRVLVNRLWHYHFGTGIVDTPSDFGFAGGRPTHPQLLDWLAARFIDGGWSIKQMHRLIVTSAAYRQASNVVDTKAQSVDADNRLLWRANQRRREGELVRDAVLAVSGTLNRSLGGPSYHDMKVEGGIMGTNAEFTEPTGEFSESTCRRTIYRLWARSGSNPMLESLDCPDPSVLTPDRIETTTPLQALSLLNNSFMEHCAQRFAQRIEKESGSKTADQIARAYRLALLRVPTEREAELARAFVEQHGLTQLCLVLLNTNEFLFVE